MNYPVRTTSQLEPLVKAFRKAKGLTQQELASKIGVTQQAIQAMEANPDKASIGRLMAVFAALDVEIILRERATEPPVEKGDW